MAKCNQVTNRVISYVNMVSKRHCSGMWCGQILLGKSTQRRVVWCDEKQKRKDKRNIQKNQQ